LKGCFDDILVADDQDGLEGRSGLAAIAGDEVHLAVVRSRKRQVRGRKASIQQPLAHGLGRCRDASYGVGRVGLNELLEDLVRELLGLGVERRLRLGEERRSRKRGEEERGGEKSGCESHA
jgi:hypothetical protein